MSNNVRMSLSEASDASFDSIVKLGLEHAGDGYFAVRKEYSNGSLTGRLTLSFDDISTADRFRSDVKEKLEQQVHEMDGVSAQEPTIESAVGSEQKSIHENNLDFWTPDRMKSCIPKPRRLLGPTLESTPALAQGAFESRPVGDAEYNNSPFSAIGKLTFSGVNWQTCSGVQPYSGTAWLIAPRIIMTVAHNLYEVNCRDESSNIVFHAGFKSGTASEMYSVVNFKYVDAYPTNPASRNDVGIGILDRDAGSLGLIPPSVPVVSDLRKILAIGYPGNHDNGQNMWMCEGEYSPELSSNDEIVMASDFGGGSSGCPWIVPTEQGFRAIGTQVGRPSGQSGEYSVSGLFGPQVDYLVAWAEEILVGSLA